MRTVVRGQVRAGAKPPASAALAVKPCPQAAAQIERLREPARRVDSYHAQLAAEADTLVGYVMELGYDAGIVITNDYYKVRVGGLPKNSFLLIRPGSLGELIGGDDAGENESEDQAASVPPPVAVPPAPLDAGVGVGLFDLLGRTVAAAPPEAAGPAAARAANRSPSAFPPHLILARVLEPAATPLSQDVARTYFEMRKSHAPEIDLFTRGELQWGAMKVAVLGTFYDPPTGSGESPAAEGIAFGGDIQNYLSPHQYSVHVPPPRMLQELVNAFVDRKAGRRIGSIRLAETRLTAAAEEVAVLVSPSDFIGSRTALFGKTRTGKSNTVKVIAQMVLDAVKAGRAHVGQVIFDLNGEYAYRNEQDKTCLYDLYSEQCVRYSLRPTLPPGVRPLKGDFFSDLKLGHRIIRELFRQQEGTPPDYMKGFLEWEPLSEEELRSLGKDDYDAATRYERQENLYRCILHEAGFDHSPHQTVRLHLNQDLRADLAARLNGIAQTEEDGTVRVPAAAPLDAASNVYQTLWQGYDPAVPLYRSSSGREYLDDTAKSMLTLLAKCRQGGGGYVSGYSKLVPFRRYHAREGGRLLHEISEAVDAGLTVIIDLSNAAEELVEFFGSMVCSAIFNRQMEKFTADALGSHHVQFYFEEAHNLFPRDDRNLRNIYNRLAKEGAKLNIGLIYSTQSIESLSPDLLKNTENFFIAHLNDEREIRALERFHEFRDVGRDVQRAKTQGFVRMMTQSHRFALPVQIRPFTAGP